MEDLRNLIVMICSILAVAILLVAGIKAVKADTLVCDVMIDGVYKTVIFTEKPYEGHLPSDISDVSRSNSTSSQVAWVGFYDGSIIYFRKRDCPVFIHSDPENDQVALDAFLKQTAPEEEQ